MENKLQQLTQKLYEEGLEKGRAQADQLIEQANTEAAKIIREAKAEAERIESQAASKAQELTKNTHTELALASRQSVASLKDMISEMISSQILDKPVAKISLDADFMKQMILAVAGSWNGASSEKTDLVVLLPEAMQSKFKDAVKGSLKELFSEQIELRYPNGVNSGFKIGPRDGGYYISFTDKDFKDLLGCFLRPKVASLLYVEQ